MPPKISLETQLADLLGPHPKEEARKKKIARLFDTRSLMEQGRVNRVLGNKGLGQLHEEGLLDQLAVAVHSHDKFRKVLSKLPPDKRQNCYDCLAPRLTFKAKPLDVYIAETKEKCWQEETENRVIELGETKIESPKTLEEKAEFAIGLDLAQENKRGALTVVCKRCLGEMTVLATNRWDAWDTLAAMGWQFADKKAYCPACAKLKDAS